jgi:hypothetical protein
MRNLWAHRLKALCRLSFLAILFLIHEEAHQLRRKSASCLLTSFRTGRSESARSQQGERKSKTFLITPLIVGIFHCDGAEALSNRPAESVLL